MSLNQLLKKIPKRRRSKVEEFLKEWDRSLRTKNGTTRKFSRQSIVVNLYNGLPGIPGDPAPEGPVTGLRELAKYLMEYEERGYLRVKIDCTLDRDLHKNVMDVSWHLSQAAKRGLIDRKYTPQKERIRAKAERLKRGEKR